MKYLKFIYILLLVTLLSGCVFNDPKYINLRTKPNLYYYSNEIYEKIKNNKSYSLKVFDVNFYEYHEVSEEDEKSAQGKKQKSKSENAPVLGLFDESSEITGTRA